MARTFENVGQLLAQSIQSPVKTPTQQFYDPAQVLMLRTYPAFLACIASFNTMNWHSKPPCLAPPICALYGWSLEAQCDVLKERF